MAFKMKGFSGFGNSPMTKKSPAKAEGDKLKEVKEDIWNPTEADISKYYNTTTEEYEASEHKAKMDRYYEVLNKRVAPK